MKLQETTVKSAKTQDFKSRKFGVDPSNLKILFNILRKKTYADPIHAVIREYSTNARDEHVKYKITKPVDICLPSVFDPTFRVRDFAQGLSEDDVFDIYVSYAASTKRNNNDEAGGLGIGCKSAFAYTDTFTITSWYGGKKTVYNCFIDVTELGEVQKMYEGDTDEPSGIEITIPVQAQHFRDFEEKTKKVLRYFDVPVNIKGKTIVIEKPQYLFKGKTWGINSTYLGYGNGNACNAIMGPIAYPIDVNIVKNRIKPEYVPILQCGIDFYSGIGDLDIATSREALEYSEKTIKTLNAILDDVVIDMADVFKKELSQPKDIIAYRKLISKIQSGSSRSIFNLVCKRGLKNMNPLFPDVEDNAFVFPRVSEPLPGATTTPLNNTFHTTYDKSWKTQQYRLEPDSGLSISFDTNYKFFLLDTLDNWKIRVSAAIDKELQTDPKARYVIVKIEDQKSFDKWAKANYMDEYWKKHPMGLVSSMPIPPKPPPTKKTVLTPQKSKKAVFKLNVTPASSVFPPYSKWWDEEFVDKDLGGHYITIDGFKINEPLGFGSESLTELQLLVERAKRTGLIDKGLVWYGVRKKDVETVVGKNPKWQPILTEIKEAAIAKITKDYPIFWNRFIQDAEYAGASLADSAYFLYSNYLSKWTEQDFQKFFKEYAKAEPFQSYIKYIYHLLVEQDKDFSKDLEMVLKAFSIDKSKFKKGLILSTVQLRDLEMKVLAAYPLINTERYYELVGKKKDKAKYLEHLLAYVKQVS